MLDLTDSVKYDLVVERNKLLNKTFFCEITSGSTTGSFDFTQYSAATLTVKLKPNDFVNTIVFSTSDGSIDLGANGLFTLSKSANQMNLKTGTYVYEMYLVSSAGKRGFLRGKFDVIKQDSNYAEEHLIDQDLTLRIKVKDTVAYTVTGTTIVNTYNNTYLTGVSKTLFDSFTGVTDTRLDLLETLTGSSNLSFVNGLTEDGGIVKLGGDNISEDIELFPTTTGARIFRIGDDPKLFYAFYLKTTNGSLLIGDSEFALASTNTIQISAPGGTTFNYNVSFTTIPGKAAIHITPYAGDPSPLADGDMWYNTGLNKFLVRENGETKDLINTAVTLTDGNGTTANGSSVDLGGELFDNTFLGGEYYNLYLGLKAGYVSSPFANVGISVDETFSVGVTGGGNIYLDAGNVTLLQGGIEFFVASKPASVVELNLDANVTSIKKIKYNSDLSSSFTNRDLIDKGYADTRILGDQFTGTLSGGNDVLYYNFATNRYKLAQAYEGLNITSDVLGIGGEITGNKSIYGNGGQSFSFSNLSSFNVEASSLTFDGISSATTSSVLYYNPTTKAVTYGAAPVGSGSTSVSGVSTSTFNAYTATTNTTLNNKLNTSIFNSYTGTTIGLSNGDKGDIIVSGVTSNVWNIDSTINKTWTGTHSFIDNNLSIVDNADSSKVAKFQVSGITTATVRTLTIPNANIIVAGSSSALTSGRMPHVTTGGLLTDTNNFRYDSVHSTNDIQGTFRSTGAASNTNLYASLGKLQTGGYGAVGSNFYINSSNALVRSVADFFSAIEFPSGGFTFKTAGNGAANSSITTSTIYQINSSGTVVQSLSPQSSATIAYSITGGFVNSSGSNAYTAHSLTPTYNTTGTYSGTLRGYYYNPAITSVVGATHIAFENTSGELRFGAVANDDTKERILVIDNSTGKVFYRSASTLVGSGSTVSSGVTISAFNAYTASTLTNLNSRLLISNFNTYSGATLTNINTRLLTSIFNTYTGATNTTLNNKLNTSLFNTYTGSTLLLTTGDKGDITVNSASSWTIDNNAVTLAKIAQSTAALCVLGRATNTIGDYAQITTSTTGHVLRATSSSALGFGTLVSTSFADNTIAPSRLTNSTLSVLGRSANSSGVPGYITATASSDAVLRVSGTAIGWGTIATAGIANSAVTLAKLANLTAPGFIGRVTSGAGVPEELSSTQATTLINTFTSTLKGLVPAPATVTGKYLKDDGTWDVPSVSGGSGISSITFNAYTASTNTTLSSKADKAPNTKQVGSAYTVVAGDNGFIIEVTGSTNSTITVNTGLGAIQFTINNTMAANTVTLAGTATRQLKGNILATQYDGCSLYTNVSNIVRGFGNLT